MLLRSHILEYSTSPYLILTSIYLLLSTRRENYSYTHLGPRTHRGEVYNDIADCLTRKGTQTPLVEPESFRYIISFGSLS